MKINLEPNIGMASFAIGNKIENYLNLYTYNFIKGAENENWDEYDFFDDFVEVYVDKRTGLIESIASRFNCTYKDVNLIGCDFNYFLNLVGKRRNELEKDEIWLEGDEMQSVYEIPDLSLQIWVDIQNEIRTVFVG